MDSKTLVLLVDAGVLVFGWGAVLLACGFAWVRGGAAERIGATIFFGSSVFDVALQYFTGSSLPLVPELVFDAVVAIAFLALALQYNRPWLGVAMLAKGVQLSLHATHLTDLNDMYVGPFNLYALGLDAVSTAIALALFFGAWSGARKAARKEAADAGAPFAALVAD